MTKKETSGKPGTTYDSPPIFIPPGIYLYTLARTKKKTWHARFDLPDVSSNTPGLRISLKTTDYHEAVSRATDKYLDLRHKHREDMPVHTISMVELFARWISDRQTINRKNAWIVKRWKESILPYVTGPRWNDITKVNTSHKHEYLETRKALGIRHRSLDGEMYILNDMFKFALRERLIPRGVQWAKPSPEGWRTDSQRRHATQEDFDKLLEHLKAIVQNKSNRGSDRWAAAQLRLALILISLTGIRPMELANLRWNQIRMEHTGGRSMTQSEMLYMGMHDDEGNELEPCLVTYVEIPAEQSKVNRYRRAYATDRWRHLYHYVMGVWHLYNETRMDPNDRTPGCLPFDDDRFIFHPRTADNRERKGVRNLTVNFTRHAGNLGLNDNAPPHLCLYSFRHFYFTRHIERGVELSELARHGGTSVRMLERHYDHSLKRLGNLQKVWFPHGKNDPWATSDPLVEIL